MARKFYLSIVYDVNGYDRYDMISFDSVQEADLITSNFKNRNDVIKYFLYGRNIDIGKGKVCLVFEDTDVKRKEINEYGVPENHTKEEIRDLYTYAHLIPILYQDRRLLNLDSCLYILKKKLFEPKVKDAIALDLKTKKGEILSLNKRYIFESEEEKDYANNLKNVKKALELFYDRLIDASADEQYFYCRTLVDTCGLSIKNERKVKNIKVNIQKIKEIEDNMELTPIEQLERETQNMDEFYLRHDLDDVIYHSPDQSKPIGSEGKNKL